MFYGETKAGKAVHQRKNGLVLPASDIATYLKVPPSTLSIIISHGIAGGKGSCQNGVDCGTG